MPRPLAYFLTWTTYGTWLPGDDRGWVRHGEGSSQTPYRTSNTRLRAAARSSLHRQPVRLSARARIMVCEGIRESCALRDWRLKALAVLSNHVHVVLRADEVGPERIMTILKAYASRRLNQAFGKRRWWTRHGSTRWIHTPTALRAAEEYVRNQ